MAQRIMDYAATCTRPGCSTKFEAGEGREVSEERRADGFPVEEKCARCCSVVGVPGGRWSYVVVKEYTSKGGTWRAGARLSRDFRSVRLAEEYAEGCGVPFIRGVRHGAEVEAN